MDNQIKYAKRLGANQGNAENKGVVWGAGSVHDDDEEEDGDKDVDQYGDSDGRVEIVCPS